MVSPENNMLSEKKKNNSDTHKLMIGTSSVKSVAQLISDVKVTTSEAVKKDCKTHQIGMKSISIKIVRKIDIRKQSKTLIAYILQFDPNFDWRGKTVAELQLFILRAGHKITCEGSSSEGEL